MRSLSLASRSSLLSALLLLLATCAAGEAARIPYDNPVWKADAPDPTVWADGKGGYFAASTAQDILASPDLVHWTKTGRRLLEASEYAWIAKGWPHVWAPDVVKIGDWYNLYLTFHRGGEHTAVAAYRSKDPAGPFTDRSLVLTSEGDGRFEVIDPEVVVDPGDGRVWLFFGHGDVRRVELTSDGRARKPGAPVEHVAGIPWDGPRDVGLNGRGANWTEGAYLHRHDGHWYLFVSEGSWMDHTYRVVVGRAARLDGTFVDRDGRPMAKGAGTPVLQSVAGDDFFGPGHNGEIFTSPSGRTYMFYHCHWTGLKNPGSSYVPRPLFLQELFWDAEGWPHFGNNGRPQKFCTFR